MLVKIGVENFRSFDDHCELTMVSSNKTRKMPEHKVKIKQTSLLKHAAIYGANAAGKSNFIVAFRFIHACLNKQLPIESSNDFCRNRSDNQSRESSFELHFTIDNNFYVYGFSAILYENKLKSEWLYKLNQDGTAKRIYERTIGKKIQYEKEFFNKQDEQDRLKFEIYAKDFQDNERILFLSEMNKDKKYSKNSKLNIFVRIFEWLTENIIIYSPNEPIIDFAEYYDTDSLAMLNEFILAFDTGISSIKIEEVNIDVVKKELPTKMINNLLEKLTSHVALNTLEADKHPRGVIRSNLDFYCFELLVGGDLKTTTISLQHGSSPFNFLYKEESDGTRRLIELLDLLLSKTEDKVFIVDEIERSLHPKLTYHFLELFMNTHNANNTQLLFTTHEASIMDQNLLRCDEIWFIERDKYNKSCLYSLDKFKKRFDKEISKAYLDGRYGAIPVLSKRNNRS